MIKFSSTKLEQAIANGVLTSWEKAKYLIFIIILYTFSGPIYVLTPSFGPKPLIWHSFATFTSSILMILFTFYGAKKCYQTNKSIDNTDFIERFVALYMPMTFKFIAVSLLAMAATALIAYVVSSDKETRKDIFIYFLNFIGPVSTYFFYIFLNRSFGRLGILINETNKNS
jgi:hypothetical protein